MAKKLFIALQTPSVEMKVKSEPDCSGKVETLTAVFLRHNTEDAQKIRNKMAKIQSEVFISEAEIFAEETRLRDSFSYLMPEELEAQVATAMARFKAGKTICSSPEAVLAAREQQEQNLRDILRSQIISLKNVPLDIQETDENGKVSFSRLVVPDTKTATDNMELWGEGSNCLNALLDVLLLSNPWSPALARAQQNVLYNLQLLSDTVSKN
jgi:hypothetical protein